MTLTVTELEMASAYCCAPLDFEMALAHCWASPESAMASTHCSAPPDSDIAAETLEPTAMLNCLE